MISQYPHTIEITGPITSHQDTFGNWINDAQQDITLACRFEPAGANGLIPGADGTLINYNWVVYMPIPSIRIMPGNVVELFDAAGIQIVADKVLRFSAGQLNARLWL